MFVSLSTTTTNKGEAMDGLMFGLKDQIPESVSTAWGARAIFTDRRVDLLPDRSNMVGPRSNELADELNRRVPKHTLTERADNLVPYEYPGDGKERQVVTLYQDDAVIVKASTNRSFGYLYLCAYFKDEA